MGTARAKAELVKFMKIRAGYQMGPVNSSPLASLAARKFPRLFLLSTDQSHPSLLNQFKLLCNSLHYRPELLLSPQAPKKLKAVAEDADTTKDSDDTAAYAEEDEADLDQVEDIFVTTKILTDYSMADHEVTKKSNSYRHQAIPSTVFKCLGQENCNQGHLEGWVRSNMSEISDFTKPSKICEFSKDSKFCENSGPNRIGKSSENNKPSGNAEHGDTDTE